MIVAATKEGVELVADGQHHSQVAIVAGPCAKWTYIGGEPTRSIRCASNDARSTRRREKSGEEIAAARPCRYPRGKWEEPA